MWEGFYVLLCSDECHWVNGDACLGGYHRLVNLLWSTGKLKVFPARWSPWRPLYCGPTGPLRTQVLMVAVLSLFFKCPTWVYTSYGLVSRFSTHFRAWSDSMVLLWPSPRQPFSEIWVVFVNVQGLLALNQRGPSYLGLTRSLSWLLMSWLLASPGAAMISTMLEWIGPCPIWGRISITCFVSTWKKDKM